MSIVFDSSMTLQIPKWRCDQGHEIEIEYMMRVSDGVGGYREYNYCPHCFGEWAMKQWPLRKSVP